MNKILLFIFTLLSTVAIGQSDLIITGVFDGPLPTGIPKGMEIYVLNDVADLSIYGVGSANNGQGTDGEEFTLSGSAAAGDFIYIASEIDGFTEFFGFAPTFNGEASMGINGDDAVELFMNGNVVDVFGDINVDGSDTGWEYLDGWAYRINGTGPDGTTFVEDNWDYSGANAFDGETSNASAATPFPMGSYSLSPNLRMVLNNDAITIQVNETTSIDVLANDNLPFGFTQVFMGLNPSNGMAMLTPNNVFNYTPNTDYCGDDTFTYAVCDSTNVCDTASVTVTIECPKVYNSSSIGDASMIDAEGNPTMNDSLVALTGVVHSINFRPGGLQFALIDANNDGIMVFSNRDSLGYTVMMGDEVTVNGAIGSFRGVLQINADEVNLNSSSNTLFDPTVVTALNEDTESQLIKIENLTIVDPADWTNDDRGFNVDVTDGTNTYSMRIVPATDIFGTAVPMTGVDIVMNVTGIGGQFSFNPENFDGYQIQPRSLDDLEILFVDSTVDVEWAQDIVLAPNPTADILNITGAPRVDRLTILNALGQVVKVENQPSINHNINVSDYTNGIYFIRFEKEGTFWATSFVKK